MDGLAIQSNAASVGNVHSVGKFAKTIPATYSIYRLASFSSTEIRFFFFIVDEISFFMPIKQTKPG